MKKKRIFSLMLVSIMMFSISSGCTNTSTPVDTTAPAATDNTTVENAETSSGAIPKVGVCIYKYDDTYISTVRQSLENISKGKVELMLNDGKGDQGTQNDQVDVMIEKGVDVLAVNMVDAGAAQTVVDKAKAANIPVIFFNREPKTDVIKSYDKARFIGTNAKDAGVIQGEIIANTWNAGSIDTNADGIMQYVMFQGEPDNPEAVARTEWSVKTAEEKGVKVEKLESQICNWDTEMANKAMEAWLSKYGDKIEFVISNNDGMAQGAIAALQASGYNKNDGGKNIPVIGVDATDSAKDLIAQKFMTGTVLQDAQGMANAILALTMNAASGKDFIDGTEYKYDDTGVAVRIPYQPYTGE